MPRAFVLRLALVTALVAGCGTLTPVPYGRGQAPSVASLLAATAPRLSAIQVPSAKIKANRTVRGGLSFIAQAPARFSGRLHAAGNELVTLAFHEQGYALRYLMDGLPEGFYSGPPSACAVSALLQVEFSLEGLVALVLGGGPVIATPHEVVDQRWDKQAGREVLTLRNDRSHQELYFRPVGTTWWFVGAALYDVGAATDERGAWRWTVEHLDLSRRGDAVLPGKTRISRPGKRRDEVVLITYRERNTEPEFARSSAPPQTEGGETPADTTPDEPDEWDDDEGWEDLDPEAATDTTPDTAQHATKPPPVRKPDPIPAQFRLSASGLTQRGDLCK